MKNLTIRVVGGGTVMPRPGTSTLEEGRHEIRAMRHDGYAFDHWSGDVSGYHWMQSIYMDCDKVVTAHFKALTNPIPGIYIYTEGAEALSGYFEIRDGNEVEAATGGSLTVILESNPSTNHRWYLASNSDEAVLELKDRKYEARPTAPIGYDLSIAVQGQGTTSPEIGTHAYQEGTSVTIRGTPAPGWRFDYWGGDASGNSPTITISMKDDKSVTAYFISAPVDTPDVSPLPILTPVTAAVTPPIVAGSGGWEIWNFTALKEGMSTILMEYKQGEGRTAAKTFALTVVVKTEVAAELYIANRNTMEVHRSDCSWVSQMKDTNKVPCSSLGEVAELIRDGGYNGCFYCLPRYDRDTLSRQQVLTNLEEDLEQGVKVPEEPLGYAQADAARRAGVTVDQVRVVRLEAMCWPNSSLGCPEPGMMYLQVLTRGSIIVLEAGDRRFTYHTDDKSRIVLCEKEHATWIGLEHR